MAAVAARSVLRGTPVAAGARLLLTRTTELMAIGAAQFHDQVRRAATDAS